MFDRRLGSFYFRFLSVHENFSAVERIRAVNGSRKFRSARAHKPRKSENFAFSEFKTHVFKRFPADNVSRLEDNRCVVRDKAEQLGLSSGLLLLRQDLLKLDLYGTIRGAVSTFDTFNHIPDLDKAIANAGFFMEKGGVLLFDMNTPYKHQNVLGENVFTFEEEDASCVWRNHYSAADRRVEISVDIDYRETGEHFHEQFYEYTYDLDTIRAALEKHGFALESVCDGESFGPLTDESERYFFCAVKQYTQLEDQ